MDISALTPEEKAAILEAAKTLQEAPQDPIQIIASALDLVMTKLEAVEEKVEGVCKTVYQDFIGGINDLASERQKAERVGGLKTNYGSMFSGPGYGEYLTDRIGDPDALYDLLDEHIQQLKGEAGDGEFDEKGTVEGIAKKIGTSVSKITGKPVAAETTESSEVLPAPEGGKMAEAPAESPVKGALAMAGEAASGYAGEASAPKEQAASPSEEKEKPKEEEPKENPDGMDAIRKHISKLKERGGQAA
jgi:hypothetical protein